MIQRALRTAGYDIVFYRPRYHPLCTRKWLLDTYGINVVLDVGGNIGQFSEKLREIGYRGKIVSFEPLPEAFGIINSKAMKDRWGWEVHDFALGARQERATIHVAGNSYSSSILKMLPRHEQLAPESRYVGDVEIQVKTLDSVFLPEWRARRDVFLKIDTQGFEQQVIEGAKESLPFVDTIQLEMSLTPLYEGETLFEDMYTLLKGKGYRLVAIEPGSADRETGEMLQLDAVFHRFA
jgi:FkbM family methyltransferase